MDLQPYSTCGSTYCTREIPYPVRTQFFFFPQGVSLLGPPYTNAGPFTEEEERNKGVNTRNTEKKEEKNGYKYYVKNEVVKKTKKTLVV